MGHTSKGEGREEEGKGMKKGERKGTGATGPPFANSWIRPCRNVWQVYTVGQLSYQQWDW